MPSSKVTTHSNWSIHSFVIWLLQIALQCKLGQLPCVSYIAQICIQCIHEHEAILIYFIASAIVFSRARPTESCILQRETCLLAPAKNSFALVHFEMSVKCTTRRKPRQSRQRDMLANGLAKGRLGDKQPHIRLGDVNGKL